MKEQKTIYAILRISRHPVDYFDCHVYTKQTSNKEKMIEYAKELKKRFPNCKIYLLPREKAKEVLHAYHKWHTEKEEKLLSKLDEGTLNIDRSKRIATLMAREAFYLTAERK